MVNLSPIPRALVPVDSKAAQEISARNYDEFQSDAEIWRSVQGQPHSILRVTMPHCASKSVDEMLADGSPEALQRAKANMDALRTSRLMRESNEILWVYEIRDPLRPSIRQVGIGGMAETAAIRTEANPNGSILRNEGIREEKARGRADLIEATGSYIGIVNHVLEDGKGQLAAALESYADQRASDLVSRDEFGNDHHVWLVGGTDADQFVRLVSEESHAFVADGNHRSAAAVMLGASHYLSVFFTADRMGLGPYNRLVRVGDPRLDLGDLIDALHSFFEIEELPGVENFQPRASHEIGLYAAARWFKLRPTDAAFEAGNAVQQIDADIVHRKLFSEVLGIQDVGSSRLTFVGANKGPEYLVERVRSGDFEYAVTLPPVCMSDFIQVCRQGQFMPAKSTWFQPKVRSGLIVALT